MLPFFPSSAAAAGSAGGVGLGLEEDLRAMAGVAALDGPQLALVRQTSSVVERVSRNGLQKNVHVVVKNTPFALHLALAQPPRPPSAATDAPPPLSLKWLALEASLVYDSEALKPVSFVKTKPIEYKPVVNESGDQVTLNMKIKVLTSQHEDMFFRVRVTALQQKTRQALVPPLELVSEPIKVISKPKQSKKKTQSKKRSLNDLLIDAVHRIELHQRRQHRLVDHLVKRRRLHLPLDPLVVPTPSSSSSPPSSSSSSSSALLLGVSLGDSSSPEPFLPPPPGAATLGLASGGPPFVSPLLPSSSSSSPSSSSSSSLLSASAPLPAPPGAPGGGGAPLFAGGGAPVPSGGLSSSSPCGALGVVGFLHVAGSSSGGGGGVPPVPQYAAARLASLPGLDDRSAYEHNDQEREIDDEDDDAEEEEEEDGEYSLRRAQGSSAYPSPGRRTRRQQQQQQQQQPHYRPPQSSGPFSAGGGGGGGGGGGTVADGHHTSTTTTTTSSSSSSTNNGLDELARGLEQFLVAYAKLPAEDRAARIRRFMRRTSATDAERAGEFFKCAIAALNPLKQVKKEPGPEGAGPYLLSEGCACVVCPHQQELARIDQFYKDFLTVDFPPMFGSS